MTGSRIIVTGATGFIGRWSVPALLRLGYDVHAVASPRLRSDQVLPIELAGAHVHTVNLLDVAAVGRLVEEVRPTHLLHFAWCTAHGIYWTSPENFSWVAASLNLVERFRAAGGQRAVIAGTCAEYDWNRAAQCEEQSTPTVLEQRDAATPYAICKASLQRLLESYRLTTGLSLAWGRIFLQYGPSEAASRLVPSVICALLLGETAPCTKGTQIRNFLYSQDVGEAFAALVDCRVEGAVNIGADHEISIAELVNTVGRIIGRPELIALGAKPMPANDPPYLVPNVSRLRREVGWKPAYDLEAGLRKTIEWWRGALRTSETGNIEITEIGVSLQR